MTGQNLGKCIVCSSEEFTTNPYANDYYPHLKYYEKDIFAKLSLNTCQVCGFSQIDPELSEEELNSFYENDYNAKYGPHYISEKELKEYSPGCNYRTLSQLMLLAQYTNLKDVKTFLDVGPSFGGSYQTLRAVGYNQKCFGLEKSLVAIDFLKKHNVEVIDSLDNVCTISKEFENKFDLILSSHNLEHFNPSDTHKYLQNIVKILSPNGYFMIEVPHDDFRGYDIFENVAPHLSFFSVESLRTILQDSGFEVIFISPCGKEISRKNVRLTNKGLRAKLAPLKYKFKYIEYLNDIKIYIYKKVKDLISSKKFECRLASSAKEFQYGEDGSKLRAVCRKLN
jgi:SAM-dependent methyltransferase